MQPNYRDTVAQKRLQAAQTAKEQSELTAMMTELKKMQLASLMGSQGKSTVILTDQTDLGDKIKDLNEKMVAAVKSIDSNEVNGRVVNKLVEALEKLDTLNQQVINNTKYLDKQRGEIVAAIKALKLSTVVNVPDQPAPKVTVQERPIDFQPLIDALKTEDSTEEEDKIDLDCYRAQDITDNGDKQYVGFLDPTGAWYIIENDVKGNKMRYVFGKNNYAEAFQKAPTYQYQLLNEAIDAA